MIRKIEIKAALNGYIAFVGCQTLVFTSRAEFLKELDCYLENPNETEKRYRATAVNRELLNQPATPCDTPRPQDPPAENESVAAVMQRRDLR